MGYLVYAENRAVLDARFWLRCQFPYFSKGLFRLTFVETDEVETMAVDEFWRSYYNPAFVSHLPRRLLAGVMLHELLHLLRCHHDRFLAVLNSEAIDSALARLLHFRWNVAGDLEINDSTLFNGVVGLPEGALFPAKLWLKNDLFAEEYFRLLEDPRYEKFLGACGSAGQMVPAAEHLGSPSDASGGLLPQLGRAIRETVAHEIESWEAENGRGSVPGALRLRMPPIPEPEVPWDEALVDAIGKYTVTIAGDTDYSFLMRNPREDPLAEIILPGMVTHRPRGTVVLDTSASMGQSALAQGLAEINGVIAALENSMTLAVICCDAAARETQEVGDAAAVEISGGGGTDLREGIGKAERLEIDFLVVFSDGFTPWPDEPPRVATFIVLVGDAAAPAWAAKVYRVTGT